MLTNVIGISITIGKPT